MVITHSSAEAFKVSFGDMVLAFNPPAKSAGKIAKFGADIALVSLPDEHMNGVENVAYGDKEPFVVAGPGEYEIKGVFVRGYPSTSSFGGEERMNTIYVVSLEGMQLCFLGALSKPDLEGAKGKLPEVDILFVPVGGEGVLSPHDAYALAVDLNPKIIIPMHYEGIPAEKDALKVFLKEAGSEKVSPIDKFTVKPKDLIDKESEVVVIKSI